RIAGLHVGDADVGAEWQAAVRGRHGVVVELLAARRRGVVHVEAGDAVEGVFLVFPDADGLFRLPGLAPVAQRRLVLVGAVALHASNYVIGFDNEVAGHTRRRAGRRIMAVTHGRSNRADHRAHDDAADHEADAERSALNFEHVAHGEHPIVPYRGTI